MDWSVPVTATSVRAVASGGSVTSNVWLRDARLSSEALLSKLRLAATYGTAALIGESLSLSRTEAAKARQWLDFVKTMWRYFYRYLSDLEATDAVPEADYMLPMMRFSGPTRAAGTAWPDPLPTPLSNLM